MYGADYQAKKVSGVTKVSGKLKVSSDDKSIGGHIETSGAHLIIEPSTEIDAGVGGSWLIDPYNITVIAGSGCTGIPVCSPPFIPTATSTIGATTIVGQLNAGTSVTLNTAGAGADAGDITISSAITATLNSAAFTLIADNNININAALSIRGAFTATAAQTTPTGKINIGANVTSTGAQTYNQPVVVTANSVLTSTTSNISFASTIDDNALRSHSLSVVGASAPIFTGAIGGATALGTLAVRYPSLNVDATRAALAVDQLNKGTNVTLTSSSGDLTLSSPIIQTLNPAANTLTLASAANFVLGSSIALIGTTTDLVFSQPTPTIDATFAAYIVGQLNAGTSVTVIGSGAFNIISDIVTSSGTAALSFTQSLANALIDINADINTGGAQTYTTSVGQVTLQLSRTLTSATSIFFDVFTASGFNTTLTINGTVTAPTTTMSLGSRAGSPRPSSLVLGSTAVFNGATLNIYGNRAAPITLTAGVIYNLSSTLFILSDNIAGGGGTLYVNGQIGGTPNPIPTVTLWGGRDAGGTSAIVFATDVPIYAGTLSLNYRRGGSYGIEINNSQTQWYITNLSVVTHTSGATVNYFRVTSTGQLGSPINPIPNISVQSNFSSTVSGIQILPGAQIYAGNVTFSNPRAGGYLSLDNGSINAYHITGTFTLTTNNNPIVINGVVGAPGDLVGALNVSAGTSTITLNAPSTGIMTSGNQTYNNPTTLASNQNLSSVTGLINFASTLNGLFSLTSSSTSGATQFSNVVGGVNPLTAITISGTANINTTTINTSGNQIYNNAVSLLAGSTRTLTSTSGSISMLGAVNGATNLSLVVPAGQFITFGGPVGATTALTSLLTSATGTTNINGGSVRTSGAQNYLNPVILGADTVLSSTGGGLLNFVSIDSDGTPRGLTLTTSAMTTLTGNIGTAISPAGILRFLTITNQSTISTGIINTTQAQTYGGAVTLSAPTIALNTNAAGTITFNNTINGASDLVVNASPTGDIFFNGIVGGSTPLNSLEVTGQANINTTAINTSGNQLFNNAVLLGANAVLTSSLANITFGGILNGNAAGRNLTVNAIEVRFKGDVGSITPPGLFTVNANIINFDGAITSVTTSGIQTYNGTGINPLMTIGVDPLFTAPSFVIAIPAVIAADTTYTSTAGDIDFQSTVDGPANLFLNPFGGFSAIFQGDVGVTTPLGSLIVTGDTTISGATTIITNGDQVYSNIMTLNNNLSTLALTTGAIYFGDQNVPTSGVFGSGFNLSAITNNAANGPTGAGITGIVRVNNFTVGGMGGANLSFNYPSAESFVLAQGAEQAIINTLISPDFRSLGVLYCVNNFCNLLPVPNPPSDIPPRQIINPPESTVCGAAGCDNLEIIVGKNYCAYSEINMNDNYYEYKKDDDKNKMYRKLLWKQEQDCLCQEDYRKINKDKYWHESESKDKWAKYCKQQKDLVYLPVKHHGEVPQKVSLKNVMAMMKLHHAVEKNLSLKMILRLPWNIIH